MSMNQVRSILCLLSTTLTNIIYFQGNFDINKCILHQLESFVAARYLAVTFWITLKWCRIGKGCSKQKSEENTDCPNKIRYISCCFLRFNYSRAFDLLGVRKTIALKVRMIFFCVFLYLFLLKLLFVYSIKMI